MAWVMGLSKSGSCICVPRVRREEIGLTVDLFQVGLTGDGPVARPLIALVDPVHAWVGLAQLGEQIMVFLTLKCVVIPQVDVDGHEGLRGRWLPGKGG